MSVSVLLLVRVSKAAVNNACVLLLGVIAQNAVEGQLAISQCRSCCSRMLLAAIVLNEWRCGALSDGLTSSLFRDVCGDTDNGRVSF